MRWYRVELDTASGAVVSCVAVEHAEQDGRSWFYVQAEDDKAAGRAVFNRYMRAQQQKRRARLIKEGKCPWCGRKNDRQPGKRCTICLVKDTEYGKRKNARIAGKPVEPLDRRVAVAARKDEERREVVKAAAPSHRLSVLLEVQEAWLNNPRVSGFTQWLEKQIAAARGKKVA